MAKGDLLSHEQVKFVEGVQDAGGNPLIRVMGKVSLDDYKTGGYAMDISALIPDLLMLKLESVGGIVYVYDYSAKKILGYWGDNNNGSDGVLIQVPDTTDTSDPTVRYEALGR